MKNPAHEISFGMKCISAAESKQISEESSISSEDLNIEEYIDDFRNRLEQGSSCQCLSIISEKTKIEFKNLDELIQTIVQ